jgi:hypothetical protein
MLMFLRLNTHTGSWCDGQPYSSSFYFALQIHGGLLAVRGNEAHTAALTSLAIDPIDLVVVNLYVRTPVLYATWCSACLICLIISAMAE